MRVATRDYARPQRPKPASPRGRPAPRHVARKNTGTGALGLPLWAWMVVSLSLLVFAAAIYYVSRPAAPMDMVPSSEARNGQSEKTIEIPPKEPSRFAFYEMLPSYEVVVPDDVLNPPKPKPGAARNNLPPASQPEPPQAGTATAAPADLPSGLRAAIPADAEAISKPLSSMETRPANAGAVPRSKSAEANLAAALERETLPQPTAQLAKGEKFLIQVAAFRSRTDAEQRVAALTLTGLAARVEQVTIDNKDTWYRVRLGPYGSATAAAAAQQRLKAQGFDGVVMKVKS